MAVLPAAIEAPRPGGPRPATAADDQALVQLAAACPMPGPVTLCNTRAPSFFALHRLENLGHPGGAGRVLVVEGPAGQPVGSIAWAERHVYLHGLPARSAYVCDLKVHADHRRGDVADSLVGAARAEVRVWGGDRVPSLLTILGGNPAMARRLGGPRGLPRLERFADLDAVSIPWLPRRRMCVPGVDLAPATSADLPDMASLWQQVAPTRQFAPVFDADGLARFIAQVPGLSLAHYWLARRRRDGRLLGFVGLWDPTPVKQTVVVRWGWRLALFRLAWNALCRVARWPRLPAAGQPLPGLVALNVCVPADRPELLRALLITGQQARGRGYVCLTVGLDRRDPLRRGLHGLGEQSTLVWACVATPAGRYLGPPLDDRPLHFEIALV